MNHGIHRWFSLCFTAALMLAGCQSKEQVFLPITGGAEISSRPAAAEVARTQVLEYLLASARLPRVPSSADWQPQVGELPEGEYHFRSGDWLMMIRSAQTEGDNQMVLLFNQAGGAAWTGYITPDGRVVDTTYYR